MLSSQPGTVIKRMCQLGWFVGQFGTAIGTAVLDAVKQGVRVAVKRLKGLDDMSKKRLKWEYEMLAFSQPSPTFFPPPSSSFTFSRLPSPSQV